jgi:hypothetical protein
MLLQNQGYITGKLSLKMEEKSGRTSRSGTVAQQMAAYLATAAYLARGLLAAQTKPAATKVTAGFDLEQFTA